MFRFAKPAFIRKIAYHKRLNVLSVPLGLLFGLYFTARFLLGKVDIPQFEIALTTKCTLRCEACINMMQYFDKDTHYTCTLSGILASLDALIGIADSIGQVRILGGEPLLFKELPQVVRFLRESPKVKSLNIFTNATLDFKEDLLEALAGARNAYVTISDYSASPNLAVPLRQESIIDALAKHKIAYLTPFSGEQSHWSDPGKIYKRGRSREDVVRNFRACMKPCVSVMSGECAKDASLAPLGAVFICPTASSLSRLKGLAEFEGDFIDIASATKMRIIEFYAQDYFKACDYCCDKWERPRLIPPAVQTKEVFRIEADQ